MAGRIYNINEAPARGYLRIGVDEAGYGPRLGPLVVAASAFICDRSDLELYAALAPRVGRVGSGAEVIVDDSKRIFQPRRGPDGLRRGCEALTSAGLVSLACRVVEVPEFNRLVAEYGNKADLLSRTSLDLARSVLGSHPATQANINFDRHGGRRRYGALLSEFFESVEVVEEGRSASRYRASLAATPLEIAFLTRADASYLEVALASMRAKLEREIAMQKFNASWAARFSGLKPTQGYPADARRFIDELRRRRCDPEDLRAMQRIR